MEYKTLGPNDATATLQRQVTGLFGQLTRKIGALPLKQVLAAPNPPFILGCMEGGQLLGMAGMATYQVLSGRKGWIEDVVVHSDHRGRGIGRALVSGLLELGQERGLDEVLLFTGHTRLTAVALYESMGFVKKDSHLYTLKLPKNTRDEI